MTVSAVPRKARAKKVHAPGIPEGVADVVEPVAELVSFSQEELLSMRVADLEAQLAVSERQLASTRKAFLLAQIDPKGLLALEEKRQAEAGSALEQARQEYRAALEKACTRLCLDPNKVTFDPQTGVVQLG